MYKHAVSTAKGTERTKTLNEKVGSLLLKQVPVL